MVSSASVRLLSLLMGSNFSSQALFGAKLGSHIWTLGRETLLLEDKVRLSRIWIVQLRQMTDIVSQVAVFLELSYSVVITLARCSLCMLFIRIFTTKSFKIAGKPISTYIA